MKKIRNILVRILDCTIRTLRIKIKTMHLSLAHKTKKQRPYYVFMVDGRMPHGGMFDRLKGAITIYAISKLLHKEFKINWTYPFDLRKYLQPAEYDWRIDEKDLNYTFFGHNAVIAYGEYINPSRLWKRREKETHFYYGYNSLKEVNEHFKCKYEWGKLYRELFKPTPYLQQHIDYYLKDIGSDYIAIHTRFLNLLGDKNETDINPELKDSQKEELIKSITEEIQKIRSNISSEMKILIASDSMTFIEHIRKDMPDVYIVPGKVKHIDTAGETNDSENIKLFTDYYLIAHAKHVYSIWHKGMWKSAFPEYAAKIGNISFTRIELN